MTGAYLATDFSGESMPGGEVIFDNGFE